MNSIEQDVRLHRDKSTLPKVTAIRIQNKIQNILDTYGINFDPTIRSLESCPSLYYQLDELPDLSKFFRRGVDIWIDHYGRDDLIYSKTVHDWITAARFNDRIAIDNPLSGRIESWSRLYSASKSRTVHHAKRGSSKKSHFFGNYDFIRPLEQRAFEEGIGLLTSSVMMRMYLGFDDAIGKSKSGMEQKYICLECERVSRSQDTSSSGKTKQFGYKVRIHGFPVDKTDIDVDFRGTSLKLSDIPVVSI